MTLSLTLQTTNLQAAEIKGLVFDDSLRLGDITLPLRGTGLLKYLVFIDAYVAAFYLEEEVPSHKVLDDVPKCLKIQYFHAIKAKDFAASKNKFIAAKQSSETVDALKPKIQQINALYDDVKPGER